MTRPVAVRKGSGPIHIADAQGRAVFTTACGRTLRGEAALVPTSEWAKKRRCRACDEIADHAPNLRILRMIAGWS